MKIIDLLLRLYPEEFRSRFGQDIRAFHRERVREPRASLIRIVADHVVSAFREQLRALGPDVRLALRAIRNRPAFAAVVILTVALGVGANGAVFSIVNGVLLKALPYPRADRVLSLSHEPTQWLVSEPQFAVYRDRMSALASLAAFTTSEGNLLAGDSPERIGHANITSNFFAVLGVQPMIGRSFTESDVERPATAVILSHALWMRRYGGDTTIVGKSITLNAISRTVVGVMPAGFEYPSPSVQLWLPICSQRACASILAQPANDADGWGNHYLNTIGRLRDGATLDDARSQATGLARAIMREHPENFNPSTPLTPVVKSIQDELVGKTRPYLLAMLGAVALVMLIVCANVANLLLARGGSRRREMAVRSAIGASRRRLVLQLLTESVVLSMIGGLAGLLLASAGNEALVALAPASLPRLDEVRMDFPVVAYSIAVAFAAGMVFGIVPAIRQGSDTPIDSLRSGGKGHSHHGGSRTRNALVVAELAVALMLLAGAGMLARTLLDLQGRDIGFRPAGAMTAKVSLNYDEQRTLQYFAEVLPRVRAIPNVRAAGAARWLPVVESPWLWDIAIDGKSYPPGQGPVAVPQEVTPGFFPAMGMRIHQGRDFSEHDRVGSTLVGIVNQAFVKRYLSTDTPLGMRFRLGGRDTWVTIVGVVADIQARGPGDVPEPSIYLPFAQLLESGYFVPRSLSIVARTDGDPLALATQIRGIVRAVDPGVPISRVLTLEDVVATATANRRFATGLILGFAGLALVLASIGIYGVMSYAVAERTYEIGLRIALGAESGSVLRLILGNGARLAGAGVLIGLIGAAMLGRLIRAMLVDASAIDAPVLLGVAAVLGGVALVAAFIPARRATRIQPTEALRAG